MKRYKYSAKRRKNISDALRQRYLNEIRAREPGSEPKERRCPHCETQKPLEEFGTRKQKRKSGVIAVMPRAWCKPCEVERVQHWKERKIAEGTWEEYRKRKEASCDRENIRRYHREWRIAKRREEGIEGWRRPIPPSKPLDPAPLIAFLEALPKETLRDLKHSAESIERRVNSLLKAEWDSVYVSSVDQILLALGCPEQMNILYPLEEEKLVGYQILDPDGILND